MSEQPTPENTETETAEGTEETEETAATTSTIRVSNPLSRPTDAVARPGFRNPSNKRSKAQKSNRKKKRRK